MKATNKLFIQINKLVWAHMLSAHGRFNMIIAYENVCWFSFHAQWLYTKCALIPSSVVYNYCYIIDYYNNHFSIILS